MPQTRTINGGLGFRDREFQFDRPTHGFFSPHAKAGLPRGDGTDTNDWVMIALKNTGRRIPHMQRASAVTGADEHVRLSYRMEERLD